MLLALHKKLGLRKRPDKTRQYGTTLEHIKLDHVERYLFAGVTLTKGMKVLDLACGCGYGSWVLHKAGMDVTGVDISQEAITYAEQYYKGPKYLCQEAKDTKGEWDAIVTFETLEHLDRPEDVFLHNKAKVVIASVPNEKVIPFKASNFSGDSYPHRRHYTPDEFDFLLESVGYKVRERHCQKTKMPGTVTKGTQGKFLIFVGERTTT